MSHGASGRKLELRCFLEGVEVPCTSATAQMSVDGAATCSFSCPSTASAFRIRPRTGVEIFYRDLSAQDQDTFRLFFSGEVVGLQMRRTPLSVEAVFQAVDDSSYWDSAHQYYIDYGKGDEWIFLTQPTFTGAGVGKFDAVFREHASVLSGILQSPPKTYPDLRGLVGGVVHLMEHVGGVRGSFKGLNDFFTMAEYRRKILAQVSAPEADDTSSRVFAGKVFWEWIMGQLSHAGSMVSIRDMIKLIFRYVQHHINPNPCAKYDPPRGETRVVTRAVSVASTPSGKALRTVLEGVISQLNRAEATLDARFNQVQDIHKGLAGSDATERGRNRAAGTEESARDPGASTLHRVVRLYQEAADIVRTATSESYRRVQELSSSGRIPSQFKTDVVGVAVRLMKLIHQTSYTGSSLPSGVRVTPASGTDRLTAPAALYTLAGRRQMERSGRVDAEFWTPILRLLGAYPMTDDTDREAPSPLPVSSPGVYPYAYTVERNERPRYALLLARLACERVLSDMGVAVSRTTQTFAPRERLHNQLILPDVWFIAPPRCNVIFPDETFSLEYQRSFLQEVTRMHLTTSMFLIPPNRLTNQVYVAPDTVDVTGGTTLRATKRGVRVLLPHEVYTGIVPVFDSMSEANIYVATGAQKRALQEEKKGLQEQARYLRALADELEKGTPPETARVVAGLRRERAAALESRGESLTTGAIPYIQRAVNWKFFKQRFASRQLRVSTVFLPRLVVGLPCLVLQTAAKMFDADPPQYIGQIAALTHTIGQDGATTQVQFTEAREHALVDDDYLTLVGNAQYVSGRTRRKKTTLRPAQIHAALTAAGVELKSADTEGTAVSKKRAVRLRAQMSTYTHQIAWLTSLERSATPAGSSQYNRREVRGLGGGTLEKVSPIGPKEVTLASVPGMKFHHAYEVEESWSSKARTLNIPFEEQVYPTWMSVVYRNEQVGKKTIHGRRGVYEQMLGCAAITDDPADTPEGRRALAEAEASGTNVGVGGAMPGKSIAEAADELLLLYQQVRDRGDDVRSWMDAYTARPIATLEQMMGSADVQLDENGAVLRGTAGFRTLAYGAFDNLEGLDIQTARVRSTSTKEGKVARALDVRKQRREAVMRYVSELLRGQGQRGG